MGGSLMQLVAVGAQDVPLIGNPQMTYFKGVFKRHTNFAMESIPLNFNQLADFGKKVTCLIARKGDLVSDLMIEIKLPSLPVGVSWINAIGHNMINKIELEIGGEIIDTIYGKFLDIYTELTNGTDKRDAYYKMIGKHSFFNKYSQDNIELTLYIPLPFWFCGKNYGRALPLIALQYHDVVVNVYFNEFSKMWYSGTSMSTIPTRQVITNAQLYADYIFLDTNERRHFAINSHSYLIEQHQICDNNPVDNKSILSRSDLEFNLPVKELIWVYQANSIAETNDWSNYSYVLDNDQNPEKKREPISTVTLNINGYDRFQERDGSYFRIVQPFKHHQRVSNDYIYVYSFAINPENAQPSGSIDFSWLNSAVMGFGHPSDIIAGNITIFAINYNYIQINKGMASLLYQS